MGLAGTRNRIPSNSTFSDVSTPKSLNIWLQNNNGYDGSNDLIEEAVPEIDPSRIFWPDDGMHNSFF
jgi:hypothetical protein